MAGEQGQMAQLVTGIGDLEGQAFPLGCRLIEFHLTGVDAIEAKGGVILVEDDLPFLVLAGLLGAIDPVQHLRLQFGKGRALPYMTAFARYHFHGNLPGAQTCSPSNDTSTH